MCVLGEEKREEGVHGSVMSVCVTYSLSSTYNTPSVVLNVKF